MIVKNAELETVCGITSKLPENGQIEVAFAGKSNVGKSSLINGLMNRKSLAQPLLHSSRLFRFRFFLQSGNSTHTLIHQFNPSKDILGFIYLASVGIRPCSASLTQFFFCLFAFLLEEKPSSLTWVLLNCILTLS